jgi:hypothetical protein
MEPMMRPGVAQSTTCLEKQVTRDRLIMLRASVGSTEASNGRLARVGVVGPTRARRKEI